MSNYIKKLWVRFSMPSIPKVDTHILFIDSLKEISSAIFGLTILVDICFLPIWYSANNLYLFWSNAFFATALAIVVVLITFVKAEQYTLRLSLTGAVLIIFNIYFTCVFTSLVTHAYWIMLLLPIFSYLIYQPYQATWLSALTLLLSATIPFVAPLFEQAILWSKRTDWMHLFGVVVLVYFIFSFIAYYLRISASSNFDKLRAQKEALEFAHAHIVQIDAERRKFIADMNHELRTPLNAVVGISHLLEEQNSPNQQSTEYLELISQLRSSTNQILTIINEVLDLTKVTEGKATLKLRPESLQKLVQDSVAVTLALAHEKGLHLVYECIDLDVLCDGQKIKQVLINLIGNAIKFTPSGTIKIQVTDANEISPNTPALSLRRIRFSVSDQGVGVAPNLRKTIFDEFNQGNDQTELHFGGSGLGLHICKKYVALMGGKIWCEDNTQNSPTDSATNLNTNAINTGTTFVFLLALAQTNKQISDEQIISPPTNQARAIKHNGALEKTASASLSILVVDDTPLNLIITKKLIQNAYPGFSVTTSDNPYHADAFFGTNTEGVLLLDLNMGAYPTESIALSLRQKYPLARIFAYTADTTALDKHQNNNSIFHGILIKPFDIRAFSKQLGLAT